MPSLEELIGQKIVFVPKTKFHPEDTQPYVVTLRGVESGGLWIQHPTLSRVIADTLKMKAEDLPEDPVFFLPYSEIWHIVAFSARLEEKSLGLQP